MSDSMKNSKKIYGPNPSFVENANVKKIDENLSIERFWEKEAERLHWFRKWDSVLEGEIPFTRWFTNGKINASYNCIDRHLNSWKKNKAALIFEGEPGDRAVYTYQDLYREVTKFSNVLKKMGINKGDVVTIYLPMIPQAVISMLACSRIGAVHSVVFGGFSSQALSDRINDSEAKLVITSDGYWRRGGIVQAKDRVDKALYETTTVDHVIVIQRSKNHIHMVKDRDYWYHELMDWAEIGCEAEAMDAEDDLFMLYTSGTTGKPKGVVHSTGGYLTGVSSTHHNVFDHKDEDVYWCAADIGWITGHSYIVYGPLSNGSTLLIYEGAPDYPAKDRTWDIVEKYSVSILYTAPTAIRMFMKWGEKWLENKNLSSLRLLGSVGEPINPEAWEWYYKNVGKGNCPIVDTWWQTETGSIMISSLPGINKMKPGSVCKPLPGICADVVDDKGESVPYGRNGYLVVKRPWPSMLRNVYKNTQRYVETYWSMFDGMFCTGDGAFKDEDGYIWVSGRVDDVIVCAGHNIGSAEVESSIVTHKSVAEAAAIGCNNAIKGLGICIFATLKEGEFPSRDLENELSEIIIAEIGKFAKPDKYFFAKELPKTRSGKIMRRLLRDVAEGRELGDTTTLLDVSVIDDFMTMDD